MDTNELHEKGFTIIDVVVTIAIVLALAVSSFVSYGSLGDQARRAVTEAAAQQVYDAANVFNQEKKVTPQEASAEFNERHENVTTTVTGENCVTATHDDGFTATRGSDCAPSVEPPTCDAESAATAAAAAEGLENKLAALMEGDELPNEVFRAIAVSAGNTSAYLSPTMLEFERSASVDTDAVRAACSAEELDAALGQAVDSIEMNTDFTVSFTYMFVPLPRADAGTLRMVKTGKIGDYTEENNRVDYDLVPRMEQFRYQFEWVQNAAKFVIEDFVPNELEPYRTAG